LLLKPIFSADLGGGGATILFTLDVATLLVVCRSGRGGRSGERSFMMGRTGSDGFVGSCDVFDRLGGAAMLGTKGRLLVMAFRVALGTFSSSLFRG